MPAHFQGVVEKDDSEAGGADEEEEREARDLRDPEGVEEDGEDDGGRVREHHRQQAPVQQHPGELALLGAGHIADCSHTLWILAARLMSPNSWPPSPDRLRECAAPPFGNRARLLGAHASGNKLRLSLPVNHARCRM